MQVSSFQCGKIGTFTESPGISSLITLYGKFKYPSWTSTEETLTLYNLDRPYVAVALCEWTL